MRSENRQLSRKGVIAVSLIVLTILVLGSRFIWVRCERNRICGQVSKIQIGMTKDEVLAVVQLEPRIDTSATGDIIVSFQVPVIWAERPCCYLNPETGKVIKVLSEDCGINLAGEPSGSSLQNAPVVE